MKLLMENWRSYLNEAYAGTGFGGTLNPPRFMLNPGEAQKVVKEGIQLEGWDRYGQLVAEAYLAAPKSSADGLKSFEALKKHIYVNFKRIVGGNVDVVFVDHDPYESAEQMLDDVRKTGVMKISSLFNQPEYFGPELNLQFRAVHDYYAHMKASSQAADALTGFTYEGEIRAFNNHAALLGKTAKALPAVFTEVVGQASVYFYTGNFPDQKLVTLPGFDPTKLGQVSGYTIIDKNLVKAGETPEEEEV